ncbi:putative ammonium transporter [Emiliania huxleyi CCMP1516]|uniref:Ammonium transporter AmtB-like domain-containing protein n=2 Tax=Emiliania huxleyi TaxID=2903 RepID=A0A0D3JCB6_EMIH1|nr:putative ammonium transporter [Emiliania huxleyi CCMP1516]EOD21151.1 putative ammonium transporter [Emiliania huxleyi CCMP1516]|eukprot:XP_005773580.1 putative ammonium transporter [Emiliania huxleyi CCMP1516]
MVRWYLTTAAACGVSHPFCAVSHHAVAQHSLRSKTLLVYYPLCHWVWGGGWLARLGVCDFAGGIVIHTSAGVASLVTALRLGPRVGFAGLASHSLAPHNLPMAATGAGLLWVGWFAFNGGSALAVGSLAASALLSTHVAGAGGALVWLALDWGHAGRPTFVGCINGALSRKLAGVTPASGYVTPSAGLVVGLEYLRIDDALDVTSIHGVTGVVGSLLLGVYASSEVNPAGPDGSLDQLRLQALGVAVAIAWSGAGTWLVMAAIERTLGSARTTEAQSQKSSYLDLAAFVKHATPTTDELFEGADLALGEVSPAKRRSGQSLSVRLAVEIAEAAMV